MKNRDHPANPAIIDLDFSDTAIDGGTGGKLITPGLTKREYAAIEAMNGYIAADVKLGLGPAKIAEWAVHDADALFDELNKS